MMNLYNKIRFDHSYHPKSPKLTSLADSSWDNTYVDFVIDLGGDIKDFIKDEFRHYYRKWSNKTYIVHILKVDEDDVQLGYLELKDTVLPFVARYLSMTAEGSKYRLYCFTELSKSRTDMSQYDFEEQIEKLVKNGTW